MMTSAPPRKDWSILRFLAATAGGLGLLPYAPGSFGALLGVIYHATLLGLSPLVQRIGLGVGLVVSSWGCLALTPWSQAYWNHKDPKQFVLDEVAGYLLTALLVSPFCTPGQAMLFGFIAFRVLDIVKVPPARQIDRRGVDGWAILLDDLVSALYAAGLIWFFYNLRIFS